MSASQLPTVRRGRTLSQRRGDSDLLVLGRYQLRRQLGAGAFGTVWAAHDERLEREVAVKILPRERVVGGRFEREARVAARLSHPAIVTLYEAAVDDGGAYLVSELVRGATLARLLEDGKLSDRDIVRLGLAVCDALDHAHGEGVVHRDVKPSNVLIPARPSSGAYPAKLTDFGVARVLEGDSMTRTGDVVGTAAYMAPEQAEGLRAGPEADLYALALVLYESLTGCNPLDTGSAGARARRLGAHLPPLRRQRRDLPRELGAGIDHALRPRPRERGTLPEFRQALDAALPQTGERRGIVAAPWRPTTHRPVSRRRSIEAGDPDRVGAPEPPSVVFDGSVPAAVSWPARAAAAAGAAATAAWPASLGLLPAGVPIAVYAVVPAVLTLVLARIGWLAVVAALAALLALAGHAAAALVLVPALLLPVVLLPLRPRAWPLCAGAVALGLVGLGGAWPAVAARAGSSLWRRAVLGACGFLWLAAGAALAGSDLFLRRAQPIPVPSDWTRSATVTVDHVLPVLTAEGILAGALVWALAAAILPWLARGARPAVDVVLVTMWSASLLSATAVAVALGGPERAPSGQVAVLGALVGGIVALLPALHRARRQAGESESVGDQLP